MGAELPLELSATAARSKLNNSGGRNHVLLLEPHFDGHRGVWVQWMALGLSARGLRVSVVTMAESVSTAVFRELVNSGVEVAVYAAPRRSVGVHRSASTLKLLMSEWRAWSLLQGMYELGVSRVPVGTVVIPYLDYALHAIALRGSPFGQTSWVGIAMRPTFHFGVVGVKAPVARFINIRRELFRRLLIVPTLQCCLSVDATLVDFARSRWRDSGKKVSLLSDPAMPFAPRDRAGARRRLGVHVESPTILVYGWLTRNKGLGSLLRILVRAQQLRHFHVLVVGSQDFGIPEILKSEDAEVLRVQQRLHVVGGWASDKTEAEAFVAADVVWLGYEQHWQSSGVLAQACHAGRPVLACDEGLIGWSVNRFKCGITVAMNDQVAVADALLRLAGDTTQRVAWLEGCRRYAAIHTVENAVDVINAAIGRR